MEKINEEIKKVLDSKALSRILKIVGIVLIAVIIFAAGVTVGFHKASFGRAWGEHYNENFGIGRMDGRIGSMDKLGMMDYFPTAHGAVGKIIKVELPTIIVQDKDNTEKSILINDQTKIQKERGELLSSDLKVDDFVVVIGTPDDKGVIEAKLIRLIPSPESLDR